MKRWLFLFLFCLAGIAEGAWLLEGFVGGARSLSTTLRVELESLPDLEIDADYETRSFESPLYYSVRLSRANNGRAWEVELIHHKVFLKNPSPPVSSFGISHGYNLLFLNYARDVSGFQLRAGGGAVIAHPEVAIAGVDDINEYQFTGPALQIAAARRFFLSKSVFLSVEGKFTAARARLALSNGSASVPNFAFHALAGLGFRW